MYIQFSVKLGDTQSETIEKLKDDQISVQKVRCKFTEFEFIKWNSLNSLSLIREIVSEVGFSFGSV